VLRSKEYLKTIVRFVYLPNSSEYKLPVSLSEHVSGAAENRISGRPRRGQRDKSANQSSLTPSGWFRDIL